MEGSQNYKSRSDDVGHATLDLLLHFWFVRLAVNLRNKFEVPSYTHSGDIEVSKL